jgi:hypothetical protein
MLFLSVKKGCTGEIFILQSMDHEKSIESYRTVRTV